MRHRYGVFRLWLLGAILSWGLLLAVRTASAAPVADSTGTVVGEVLAGGKPVAYANVIALGTRMGTVTDTKGRFLIKNLPLGEQSLRVVMMGYNPVTRSIHVVSGASSPVRIILAGGQIVSGYQLPFYLSTDDSMFGARTECPGGRFQIAISDVFAIDYWMTPSPGFLVIEILDRDGTIVRSFPRRRVSQGRVEWDGKGSKGQLVPKGMYQVRFTTDSGLALITFWRGHPPTTKAAY